MKSVYAGFRAEGEVTGNWWVEMCLWQCYLCRVVCECLSDKTAYHLHICLSVCLSVQLALAHVQGGSKLRLHLWRLQYYFCWLLCNLCSKSVRLANLVYCSGHQSWTHLTLSTIRCGVYVYIFSCMQICSMKTWIKWPSHAYAYTYHACSVPPMPTWGGKSMSMTLLPKVCYMVLALQTVECQMRVPIASSMHVQPCINYMAIGHMHSAEHDNHLYSYISMAPFTWIYYTTFCTLKADTGLVISLEVISCINCIPISGC